METVIKAIGLIFVLIGIVYMSQPVIIRKLLDFFAKGKRLYIAALVRLILAVVFFVGARECGISWLIFVFGVIFLISGLIIVAMGPVKLKPVLEWYQQQSTLVLRIIAAVPIIVGGIIIYAA